MSDEVRKIDLNLPVDAHINQTAAIHASLTSTMDRARAELSNGGPSGLVVAADFQTSGRGRYDRRWESPRKGDLLMSIGLRPTATAVGLLSVAAGLAVLQAVESMANVETTIKWPNDVRIRPVAIPL